MELQLANRYMRQLGVGFGVYVVVWMAGPAAPRGKAVGRPRWGSIDAAREAMEQQAQELAHSQGLTIIPLVIDASLR